MSEETSGLARPYFSRCVNESFTQGEPASCCLQRLRAKAKLAMNLDFSAGILSGGWKHATPWGGGGGLDAERAPRLANPNSETSRFCLFKKALNLGVTGNA